MKGAIIGDIVGSVYEFNNIKTKKFPFYGSHNYFTDDSVLTVAVADALMETGAEKLACITQPDPEDAIRTFKEQSALQAKLRDKYVEYGKHYEGAGYGGHFLAWLDTETHGPYYSCGNGSAMRVSSIGLMAKSEQEAITLARLSAVPTHNHPDGINGAVATALCIHAAKTHDKNAVRKVIQQFYPYTFSLNAIRDSYHFGHFQALNAGTVPYAVEAFLESDSFEDAIRNAISIGGDSDTLAAITGGIAEAYYGVPTLLWKQAMPYLSSRIIRKVDEFYRFISNDS